MILSPNKSWRKIFFLSCPSHCDRELIVIIVYYLQIWKKKHIFINSRVISSPIGHMYIETPYINSPIDPMYIETPYIMNDLLFLRWRIGLKLSSNTQVYTVSIFNIPLCEIGLKKFIGWRVHMMTSYLLLIIFWPIESKNCNTHGRRVCYRKSGEELCWKNKPHQVTFREIILVSLWTLQPTIVHSE